MLLIKVMRTIRYLKYSSFSPYPQKYLPVKRLILSRLIGPLYLYEGCVSVKLCVNELFISIIFTKSMGNDVTFHIRMVPTDYAYLLRWWPTTAVMCYS